MLYRSSASRVSSPGEGRRDVGLGHIDRRGVKYVAMNDDELKRLLEANATEMRRHVEESAAETRRHVDVRFEHLESRLEDIVADLQVRVDRLEGSTH